MDLCIISITYRENFKTYDKISNSIFLNTILLHSKYLLFNFFFKKSSFKTISLFINHIPNGG